MSICCMGVLIEHAKVIAHHADMRGFSGKHRTTATCLSIMFQICPPATQATQVRSRNICYTVLHVEDFHEHGRSTCPSTRCGSTQQMD